MTMYGGREGGTKWDYHTGIHDRRLESKEGESRRPRPSSERREENLKLCYEKGKEKKGTCPSVTAYNQLITNDTAHSYQLYLKRTQTQT